MIDLVALLRAIESFFLLLCIKRCKIACMLPGLCYLTLCKNALVLYQVRTNFLGGYQRLISALIRWSLRLVADSVASRGGGMVIDALTIKDRHMRFKRHHSAVGLPDII